MITREMTSNMNLEALDTVFSRARFSVTQTALIYRLVLLQAYLWPIFLRNAYAKRAKEEGVKDLEVQEGRKSFYHAMI